MNLNQFVKLLSVVRRADDALGETLSTIAVEVLEQWHQHGNRTPHMTLILAIDGGKDENGFFGEKGAEIRGVSASIGRLFAGLRRLPKRDADADVEVQATEAIYAGIKTRAEAQAESKHRAEARKAEKAKAEKLAAAEARKVEREQVARETLMIYGAAGEGTKISGTEYAALMATLEALRDQAKLDSLDLVTEVIVREVGTALVAA